jgi:beta-lactamase regulating signal transducer with metallopeptidase domain
MMYAVLDHLWQSTLLALAAAVLVLAFRKASAGVRYALWLSASLKFLIPFAALAALGRLLAPAGLSPAGAAPEAAMVEQAVKPLAQFPFAHASVLEAPLSPAAAPAPSPLAQAPLPAPAPHLDLGLVLLAVWVLGSAAVLIAWAIRWARVRRIVRSARPIAWPAPMPVKASASLMEPGLIGFFRPVLIVPESLPEHLSASEVDAILAHEISHLRRRDNLTAALHMLVEALFWFHPMVWWIGGRMIAEREQACDEAVVKAGHDRATYARSLVESCRLYLQSPLSCVAGASGSDLKARVEAIMTAPPSSPLSRSKKALLLAAGACAFATPVAAGLLATPQGQKAVARARAITAVALGVPSAPEAPAEKPVVLARNEGVLGPALTITRTDAAPASLSQSVAAPRVETPAAEAAAQPVQVATAAPPPARAPSAPAAKPAPLAANPEQAKTLAAQFVKSYADATPFRTIGRWASLLCVNVAGLSYQQGAAVRERIAEVADSVGLTVRGSDCIGPNIEIGFTNDPQAMLDNAVKASRINPLGDRTSDTLKVKTVTLPIQAWYVTNGELYAQNDRRDANPPNSPIVPVVYQPGGTPPAGAPQGIPGSAAFNPSPGNGPGAGFPSGGGGGSFGAGVRAFTNVIVIVDLRKTGNMNLGTLADYAAMLALSQPRALGQCNVLPSITDLFATCPGRPAPDGLTPADTAYLTGLYSASGAAIGSSHQAHVIQRMADLIVDPQAADRDLDKAKEVARGSRQGEPAKKTARVCGLANVNSFGRHDGAPTPLC